VAQTQTTCDLQPKLGEHLIRHLPKTLAPTGRKISAKPPIFGNHATGYMEDRR